MSSRRVRRTSTPVAGSATGVLAVARDARRSEEQAAARILQAAVEWAALHEPTGDQEPAYWWEHGQAIPLAGDGVPLVSEWAVAEFAAALGASTEAGRALLAQALELAHRLPALWGLVQAGRVPAWRARRVAEHTIGLSPDAAGFVDRHLAAVAGKVGPTQLDRLITEARHRFMAATVPVDAYDCPDRRHLDIEVRQVSFDGTVAVHGRVDLADALHLDQALALTAEQLRLAGSAETLDARRATALGELARHQLTLTYNTDPPGYTGPEAGFETRPAAAPQPATSTPAALQPATAPVVEERAQRASRNHHHPRRSRRPVTLYLHLSADALTNHGGAGGAGGVGRCENTQTPINPEAIRAWCGHPDARVVVKPVIDLDQQVRVDAYEVPDRLKERVALRDVTCVFPWCSRPARGCDTDHATPYDLAGPTRGGPTCTSQLAALCRHHHRYKTHSPWHYLVVEPGVHVWTSPHGLVFLRDHTGTTDVTPAGSRPAPSCTHPPDD